ncbi:MAG: heat-inducible transcriptional repressor HrcA [Actinomycetota bacterium]|nr:heat-inducible transcriptional repressor HrcA [Actinomycetota bacterium]
MDVPDLDERKKRILGAVAKNFILSGKPVSSQVVAKEYDLGVSAATVRNDMMVLEELGFLEQPHTSAGRIPTDMAYRYYVDMLMGKPLLTVEDRKAVEKLFAARTRELEAMFQEVSRLLSELTKATAMVFSPISETDVLYKLELVRLGAKRVMAVFITRKGQVGRQLLTLEESVSVEEVEQVAEYINCNFSGKKLSQKIVNSSIEEAGFAPPASKLFSGALDAAREYLSSFDDRVFIGGTANIAKEMRTMGTEWVQILLEAIEKQYFILDLLEELIGEEHLTVRIGRENKLSELKKCALIGTSFQLGFGIRGSLGVLGPTSIDYARTIGLVQHVADKMGRSLFITED